MPQVHNPFQSNHVFGEHAAGTVSSIVLTIISGLSWLGVYESVDHTLGIIAKLVAIAAGVASTAVAIRTYKKAGKNEPKP